MKTAIILGGNSDIGKELATRLKKDEWKIVSYERGIPFKPERWDLVICCIGVLYPIGKFFDTNLNAWEQNVDSNVMLPLRLMRNIWEYHKPGASVCFFSGAGTSNSAQTYSAYSASKMMLYKMTELLDDEEPDTKFFILG